jgi:MoxR-like ATPase
VSHEQENHPPAELQGDDLAAVERLRDAFENLKTEMGKVIVGQENVLEELLVAIFARGTAC